MENKKEEIYIYSLEEFLEHHNFNIELKEYDNIKEFEKYYPNLIKGIYNEREIKEYSSDMYSLIGNKIK